MTAEQMYGACLKVIRETLAGAGAVRGVPCELESIDDQSDAFLLTFKWEESDGTVHRQELLFPKPQDATAIYDYDELQIGSWVNGEPLYRKTILVDHDLAKDNTIKVCDRPTGMTALINATGLVQTEQGSYSNNEILIYANTQAIFCKQNFTSYPAAIYVTIEYIK